MLPGLVQQAGPSPLRNGACRVAAGATADETASDSQSVNLLGSQTVSPGAT